MSTRILVCGRPDNAASLIVDRATTQFWCPQGRLFRNVTETDMQWRARDDFTLSNLFARVTQNNLDADSLFRSRINAADGNQVVTFGANTTGTQEDTTNTDALTAAGAQLFNSTLVSGSGAHGDTITVSIVSFLLEDTDGDVNLVGISQGVATVQGSLTRFINISGFTFPQATEADAQYRIRVAPTFDEMRVFSTGNGLDNNTSFSLADDGVATSVTVTIVAKTAGEVEDLVNSATPASGSLMDYIMVTGASNMASEVLVVANVHIAMDSDGRTIGLSAALGGGVPSNTSGFNTLNGNISAFTTTESDADMEARVAFRARNAMAFASANTCDAQTDVRLRKNQANSSILMSYAATTSGEVEDTTNTEDYAPTDDVNWLVDTTASTAGDSILLEVLGFEMANIPAEVDDMSWYAMYPQGIERVGASRPY